MATWQKVPQNFELATREEAAAAGRKLYFTNQPCKHGHVAPRYVTTGGCLGCLERWKRAGAKNPHSHDLVPYVPTSPFWRSKRLDAEQLKALDKYVQLAVTTFCTTLLPALCKVCDGTRYVPVAGQSPPRWELCTACAVPEPSTADVPTGTTV